MALLVATQLSAQCVDEIPCSTEVDLCGETLSGASYTGDVCFLNGTISNSVNINGAKNYTFTDVSMNQVINLNGIDKIYSLGENYFYYLNFTGKDTMYIWNETEASTIISNNSFGGLVNVVYLIDGGSLTYSGHTFTTDTVLATAGGTGNNIHILTCTSTPLPIKIIKFQLKGRFLQWEVAYNEEIPLSDIEHSLDGKTWKKVFTTTLSAGSLLLKESGLYRLKSSDYYSNIVQARMEESQPHKTGIYDMSGRKYNSLPDTHGIYMIDGKKVSK